jgi:2-polyprenyl-6-hydroxyphenyl methylase/3-demethylubiquinone-9 3-methyltransferase
MTSRAAGDTIDSDEVAKFDALAARWWDPHGPMAPLFKLNPVRLAYVRDRLAEHFGRDPGGGRPLAGLRILDVGCGGGLLCEPLCRLGAEVTGIDAAENNVRVAARHAEDCGLAIDYRCQSVESLAATGERFDAVVCLEVVEHVADLALFLEACAGVVGPGGALVFATINRTAKAFALAIVGAEYVLRWLPRGTHDWRRFVRPSELAAALRPHGVTLRDLAGVAYSPASDHWHRSRDLAVNYMAFAVKTGPQQG